MKTKELLLWMLSGFGLRLSLVVGRFLWYDESFTGLLARQPLAGLLTGTGADVHPPLYYLLIWPIQHLVDAVSLPGWVIRLPSLLAGVAAIWLMSKAAPALGLDERLSRVLVAVTAITPPQIWYSSEARQYALLTALFLAAAWAMGRRRWGWFTIAAIALVYTHNYGMFYSAALALFGLMRNWRDWSKVIRAALITFATWLPWGTVLAWQIARIDGSYWLEPISQGPITTTLVVLLAGFDMKGPALIAAGGLGITLLMISVTRRPPLGLWAMAVLPPVLAGLASATVTNLWLFRALTPAQPFMVGMALWPFIRSWENKTARWLAVAMIAPVLIGGLITQQQTGLSKENDSAAAAIAVIRAEWQPGDLLVHMTDGSAVHLGLKAPDLPQVKLTDCDRIPGGLTDISRRAMGIVEVDDLEQYRGQYKRIWLASGIGINSPVCMIDQTAALVGDAEPVYQFPFADYFVDEIYLVDLSNQGN
jgi:hypothetical protein